MELNPQRINIFEEETNRRSSLSEALFSRVGASINFINQKQYDSHAFHFNGDYGEGVLVSPGLDGIFPILFDMEIVGITMWNRMAGTSGVTEIDLIKFSGSGNEVGSIFSVTPKFNSQVGDNAFLIKSVLSDTVLTQPSAGSTEPVFSSVNIDAGEAIFCQIKSAMNGAQDCSILINFRPR